MRTGCVGIENKFRKYAELERRVRQRCLFSPDLFNPYSEKILRELDVLSEFDVGSHYLNDVRMQMMQC